MSRIKHNGRWPAIANAVPSLSAAAMAFQEKPGIANSATPSALSGFWRCLRDQVIPETPYPASSGRRTRSGRTSRQSSPSNSAENWAGDIFITPSCALGQTNFAPSRRL